MPALHPVDNDQRLDVVVSSENTIKRSGFARTLITFEAGGAIRVVQTAFESCRVTLSNLPEETGHKEVLAMAKVFGPLQSVVFTPSAPGTTGKAELEYLSADCAKTAAATLDGQQLHTRPLTAQLNLRSAEIGTADVRSSTLKMSWFAPSRTAYAHYASIHEAVQKALELDGRTFAGRKVSASFQEPSPRQTRSFTVIVKGLPLCVQADDLKKFCSTLSMDIGQANYHGKEGIEHIRKLLEAFGPLESFDHCHLTWKDVKVRAHVRFAKPEHAFAAATKLRGQSHTFLGGAKTWVTLLHSIKYNIPKAQFNVLKEDLRRLQAEGVPDAQNAKARVYDTDDTGRAVDPVCIRIYGDDPKMLGRLKTEIEGLLLGEEIIQEGMSLWDDFFLGTASRQFVADVQKESGAFVGKDLRKRKLRLSGSRKQKDHARELLLRKIQELQAQVHQLELSKHDLGRLLQGEFARLQGILGEEKLSLNIRARILVVRGDEEHIQVARLALRALEANVTLPATRDIPDCPVCFCEVNNPVKLTCGHTYCFACLLHFLVTAENFPVGCLGEDGRCGVAIPLSTISHILPPKDETKFFDTAFLAYIHQRPNEFRYCPTPDCQMIYRPAEPGIMLRCFSCLARICPSCHVEFHEGLTCKEHHEHKTGGAEAFQRWREANNIKACPGCKADTEKFDGCNHITCLRCRTHWCWVCQATFPTGSGTYEHMNAAHGTIYDRGGIYDPEADF